MAEIPSLGARARRLVEGALEAGTPESRRFLAASILAVVALLGGEAIVTIAPAQSGSSSGQSSGSPAFPPTPSSGPGSPSASLMAQVVAALQGCARTTSARPLNCPQSATRAPAEGVTWTLHGDPTQGAVLFPGRGDQSPAIVGHYVMVAGWPTQSRSLPNKEVVTGLFLAPVEGSGIGPLSRLDGVVPNLPPLTPDSRVTKEAALALVTDALDACQATTVRDWPVDCPDQALNTVTYDHDTDQIGVRAVVDGDLAANAALDFDRRTGLSILTGSYALRVTWSGPKPGQSQATGNYRALLVWDADHLSFLQIVYVS